MPEPRNHPALSGGLAATALLALVLWMSGWTGPDAPSAAGPLLWVLLTSGPLAALWLLGAAGLGLAVTRMATPEADLPAVARLAVGISLMLWLDAALGRAGLLGAGGGVVAWVLPIVGAAALVPAARRGGGRRAVVIHPLLWCALPALAVLIVAAGSAPGWLWRSEFGGYDALSYHLQLPREWMAAGRIFGPEHNVYGFLPGYVEAAYLHLAELRGDPVQSALAAQLLHAALAVVTALTAGAAVRRLGGGAAAGAATTALLLATPWVVVVGSLAYNELAVAMMLAAGLVVLAGADAPPARRGALVGWLAGVACGAKLTAAGLVAAPLAVALLATVPPRRWGRAAGMAVAAGVLALLPYLAGNLAQTGNPVFPFLGGVLGTGHWSAAQADLFMAGHRAAGGVAARAAALWDQLGRYGIGAAPKAGEPWLPQWALLPWLAIAGAALAAAAPDRRRWTAVLGGIVLLQVAFWATATHLQSRFLLPAAVPFAVLAGLGAGPLLAAAPRRRAALVGLGVAVLGQSVVTAWIFRGERGERPAAFVDAVDLRRGDGLAAATRGEMATVWPEVYVNHVLPESSRVLLVGEAAPFYYHLDRIVYQTTWDRGPLSQAMAERPDDPAAWLAALRARGLTHLLVRPEMLELWARSGWNDPSLTAPRVIDAAERHATRVQEFAGGIVLYELR